MRPMALTVGTPLGTGRRPAARARGGRASARRGACGAASATSRCGVGAVQGRGQHGLVLHRQGQGQALPVAPGCCRAGQGDCGAVPGGPRCERLDQGRIHVCLDQDAILAAEFVHAEASASTVADSRPSASTLAHSASAASSSSSLASSSLAPPAALPDARSIPPNGEGRCGEWSAASRTCMASMLSSCG
jgi:hypothetical protein